MNILQKIPLGNGIQISPPGHFVAVNSSRYLEQYDEEVHPWEGYLCASVWFSGYLKTLRGSHEPPEGTISPPYGHS